MDSNDRATVLDVLALVLGSAVASLHVLPVIRGGLSAVGWVMAGLCFVWLAVTATGPFLYVVRGRIRRTPGFPGVGERLWAWLGAPWALAALLQSTVRGPDRDSLVWGTLVGGVAIASVLSMIEVWSTWVLVSPEQAARVSAGSWTNRVGLALAIAWPIQCGLALGILE